MEYVAPAEYLVRPPQPLVYVFVMDVSRMAVTSGLLQTMCDHIRDALPTLRKDERTQVCNENTTAIAEGCAAMSCPRGFHACHVCHV